MGELVDLQAYKEKKLAEEVDAMFQELKSLGVEPEEPKPYWPIESNHNFGFRPCSISDYVLEYYLCDDYFTETDLWLWLKGVDDEGSNPTEGLFGEDK